MFPSIIRRCCAKLLIQMRYMHVHVYVCVCVCASGWRVRGAAVEIVRGHDRFAVIVRPATPRHSEYLYFLVFLHARKDFLVFAARSQRGKTTRNVLFDINARQPRPRGIRSSSGNFNSPRLISCCNEWRLLSWYLWRNFKYIELKRTSGLNELLLGWIHNQSGRSLHLYYYVIIRIIY